MMGKQKLEIDQVSLAYNSNNCQIGSKFASLMELLGFPISQIVTMRKVTSKIMWYNTFFAVTANLLFDVKENHWELFKIQNYNANTITHRPK